MKINIKYIFYVVLVIILSVPLLKVDALSCNKKVLNVEDTNFTCSDIEGNLTFTFNGQDYSKFFELWDDGKTVEILPAISFPTDVEIASIEVKDSSSSTTIKIKNNKYVTTTTTTKAPENMIVITFDKNDGSEISTKKCSIIEGSDSCSIVFPKLSIENFNGWGTQKECKEGITGTIKVYEDATYYACYNVSDEEVINNSLFLKDLVIVDTNTGEEINYGVLDNTKDTYNIRVLYDVNNLQMTIVPENESVDIKIEGNLFDLNVGENVVYIKLIDRDNNHKVYTLNITRLEEGIPLNMIHYLSSLVIGGSEINFDKDIFVYNVTIEKEIEQLLIQKETYYEEDVVTVKGNENLVNGSKILIEVTGNDDVVTTYTINVFKEESSNLGFILLFVLLGVLILLFILMVYIKNNKKGDKEVRKTKEKIKKVKKTVKTQQPDVLVNDTKSEDIEILDL